MSIFIEDEANQRTLEFTGPDAQERAEHWAEYGNEAFDRAEPQAGPNDSNGA